jgi:hypothetical protein
MRVEALPPLGTIVVRVLFALAPLAFPCAQAEEPSLAETLAWMDSTYNPHDNVGGGFGHGREEILEAETGNPFKRRFSFFTYSGCDFTLHRRDDPTAPLYSGLYSSHVDSFNLRDIDLTSIKIYRYSSLGGLSCDVLPNSICDVANIEFTTRNQEPLIKTELHIVFPKLQGSEHDAWSNKPTFVSEFYVDDPKYAERFAKAFRHAVALCGGKVSPF